MKKIRQILDDKKFTRTLLGVGTLFIIAYYLSKVPQIYVVWELVDEYGYLANAAFLSGNAWPFITHMYYGYGYSLWLVPLFWICKSGVEVIRGAIIINALCIVTLFWVQYVLMSKVCKNLNKNLVVIGSFVLCFYPYIVACGLKVLCETLLVLMIWVCGLLLYYAIDTGKWYYYVLLAISMVYTFFVHTRALVFCGALVLVIGIMFLAKKIKFRQLVAFALPAIAVLLLGFMVKNQVISGVYTYTAPSNVENVVVENEEQYVESSESTIVPTSESVVSEPASEVVVEEQTKKVGNTLSIEYIFNRILDVFRNFSIWYVYAFACRNFYLFVGTAGLFHVGIFVALKAVISEVKSCKKISAENGIKLLYTVGAVLMLIAVVIQSPGNPNAPAYNFYGRYYEYLIGPVVFFGLDYCIRERMKLLGVIAWLVVFGISYWITMETANHLHVQELNLDSARMAALSFFGLKQYYRAVVKFAAIVTLLVLSSNIVLNNMKRFRCLLPIVLLLVFAVNNIVIQKEIMSLQRENKEDYEMVTYIQENYNGDEVHFLNSGFSYPVAYAGIQPLLGKTRLTVLEGEETQQLEAGDVFICFHNNPYLEQIELPMSMIYETTYYGAYMVE